MKNTKKVLLFLILFIFSGLIIIFINDKNNNFEGSEYFSSPQVAIEKSLKTTDYVVVIDNETAFASCNTTVNNKNCQYLIKDNSGWKIITNDVFDNPLFFEDYDKHGYALCVREYNGKYMIYLMQMKNHIEKNGEIDVCDSLDSSFKEFEHKQIYDYHFWYCCLDELPSNYKISINDQIVFDNQQS